MKHDDLIVEIQTEELPAKMVPGLLEDFEKKIKKALESHFFSYDDVTIFSTPRRIAALIHQLAPVSTPERIRKKGPPVKVAFDGAGHPTPALAGFLKQNGVTLAELGQEETPKGHYFYVDIAVAPEAIEEAWPRMLKETLTGLHFDKAMRWGKPIAFPRPIRAFWAMYGRKTLSFSCWDIPSQVHPVGHRVHHAQPVAIQKSQDYVMQMEGAHVCVVPEKRRERIMEAIGQIADKVQGTWLASDDLIEEIVHITEWPQPILGHFDAAFLVLPPELILCVLTHHQRYIAIKDPKTGQLMPLFIAVSNIESQNVPLMVAGYERVLTARLSDALYFYQQDLKEPLFERVAILKKMMQHQAIGTLSDQQDRIRSLVLSWRDYFPVDEQEATSAANLIKCDLGTHVVQEFPELHGIMGAAYWAAADRTGEQARVSHALRESILPTSAEGPLPQSDLGRVLALADKVDTLVGLYAVSKPTGTQDPFGLRRLALAIMRLLTDETGLGRSAVDLSELFHRALHHYPVGIQQKVHVGDLVAFCFDRLKSQMVDKGRSVALFYAVDPKTTVPVEWLKRLDALEVCLREPTSAHLIQLNKRLKNILKEMPLSTGWAEWAPDWTGQEIPSEEKALGEAFLRLRQSLQPLFKQQDYVKSFQVLFTLEAPLASFFEAVLVMDPDPTVKARRLTLLSNIYALVLSLADFSAL